MPWDAEDRRFRQVEKTLADVGAQPIEGGPGEEALDYQETSARPGGRGPVQAVRAPSGIGDLQATLLASPQRKAFRIGKAWIGGLTSPGGVALVPARRDSGCAYAFVVRDQFRIGRAAREVDFAAWFLPRSPRNDILTRRISRVHATLAVEGGRLWIEDGGTANGTTIDAVEVKGRTAVPLTARSEVVLAGEYHMIVDPIPVAFPNLEAVGLAPAPADAPCGAVRFHAAEGPGPERRPVWLLRQVAFGRGRDCGIQLADDALAERHGVFCVFGGVVWVGVVEAGGSVLVDGVSMEQGDLAPLRGARSLKIGQFEFGVEEM